MAEVSFHLETEFSWLMQAGVETDDVFIYFFVGWCLFLQCCFYPSKDGLEPIEQLGEFACVCSNYIIEQAGTGPRGFSSSLPFPRTRWKADGKAPL